METEHYDPEAKVIRMGEYLDDDEYAEVFRHEYGHFADDEMGSPSTAGEFESAIDADLAWFADPQMKAEMLADLKAHPEVMADRCVSDILSGLFHNDSEIMAQYYDASIDFYGHSDTYWKRKNSREQETFANMFSIYSSGSSQASEAFLTKYFKNATRRYKKLIGSPSS